MRFSFLVGALVSVAWLDLSGDPVPAEMPDDRARREAHKLEVLCVAFSPDGETLASAGRDDTIKLWEVKTERLTATLKGHSGEIWCVTFSPDGKMLASAGPKTVRVWDAKSGKNTATCRGHTDGICWVCFSPDGKTLASAGADKSIKLWDAKTGQNLATLTGHVGAVISVAFSPDGKTLASGRQRGDRQALGRGDRQEHRQAGRTSLRGILRGLQP
jgi:WD40 repeat protein